MGPALQEEANRAGEDAMVVDMASVPLGRPRSA